MGEEMRASYGDFWNNMFYLNLFYQSWIIIMQWPSELDFSYVLKILKFSNIWGMVSELF